MLGDKTLERSEGLPRNTIRNIIEYVIIFILSVIIAAVVTGVYIYFKLPNQAIINLPGKMFPATELIEDLDDTSLHGLSVRSIITENRNDFVKYMWHEKKLHLNYTYNHFTSSDELIESHQQSTNDALEAEKKAADAIIDYIFDHYAKNENEAIQLLEPLTWYMDYLGDSSTMLITISLIGMYEDKPWFNSTKKVAMTGSMDAEGNVLPVGSVPLKTMTAKKQKADVLIVPEQQLDQTKRFFDRFWQPVTIIGVKTIEEAIHWLDQNIP